MFTANLTYSREIFEQDVQGEDPVLYVLFLLSRVCVYKGQEETWFWSRSGGVEVFPQAWWSWHQEVGGVISTSKAVIHADQGVLKGSLEPILELGVGLNAS